MFILSRINFYLIVLIFIVYCGLHYLLYYSIVRMFNIDNNLYRRAIFILIAFLGSSFFLDSFLGHHSNNVFTQTFPFLIGYWLSLFPILLLSIILLWILYWVHQKSNLNFSLFYIYYFLFIVPFLIIGYGIWQGLSLEIKNVDIPVKNLPDYWKDK